MLPAIRPLLAPFARRRGGPLLATLALVAAGCGSSAELPPAAGPDRSPPLGEPPAGRIVATAPVEPARPTEALVDRGRKLAVLSPRERVLEVYDAQTRERLGRAPAGAGPTHVVAGEGGLAYVVDTAGDGLLVFETSGKLRIRRRYPLRGAPYAAASDLRRGRLWVTLTAENQLVELATSARPHRLNVYPTVRQPNAVSVDSAGRVYVHGDQLQLLDPRRIR
jgi:DNA-binding beta-propeller fold protein YncE